MPQVDILIHQVIKNWVKIKKQTLEQSELTCSQFEMLSAIYYLTSIKQEIIQVDLAHKTEIDPMTTSTILRNLEKKGLITRNRGVENTRIVIIKLTDKGLQIYKKAYSDLNKISQTLYDKVDKEKLSIQLSILYDKLSKLNN